MARCQKCGCYCDEHYTYCKKCYLALGRPYNEAVEKMQYVERKRWCRGCGKGINSRYAYCMDCAKRKGFMP